MKVNEGTSDESAEGLLDAVWSLQYMTGRGILCAFAGQTDAKWSKVAQRGSGKPQLNIDQPSHAIHIRFTDLQVRFLIGFLWLL